MMVVDVVGVAQYRGHAIRYDRTTTSYFVVPEHGVRLSAETLAQIKKLIRQYNRSRVTARFKKKPVEEGYVPRRAIG